MGELAILVLREGETWGSEARARSRLAVAAAKRASSPASHKQPEHNTAIDSAYSRPV